MADQDMAAKKQHFMSRYTQAAGRLRDAWFDLSEIRAEWNAMGYSTGSPNAIAQNDIPGGMSHLTPDILGSGLSTFDALKAVLDAGHMTNLMKLLP